MRAVFTFLIGLNFMAGLVSAGENTISIPLPELEGFYEVNVIPYEGTERVTSVEIGEFSGELVSVGLRIVGDFTPGTRETYDGHAYVQYDWGSHFMAVIPARTDGINWICELNASIRGPGVLEWPGGFMVSPTRYAESETMDFIRSGAVEIRLKIWSSGLSADSWPIVYRKTADLDEVSLLLTIETLTPTGNSSWGSVKALFR